MGESPSATVDLVDDQPPRISWRMVFLLFTAGFALRFAYFTLDDLTRDRSGTFITRLIEEGTGAYTLMALFPLMAFAERRFPLSSGRWRRNWSWHLLAFVPVTALHTSLMGLTRWVVFPGLGLGHYDYGRMPLRYFMEAPEDLISYATILCLLTFLRVQRDLRTREVRAVVLERDAANARLESLSLRLHPHFLFNAMNAISSTVYDDPVAADEMIGRLGDLLRQVMRTSDRQEIIVREELDTLRAYLLFVEARFGDRVRCTLDVSPTALELAVPVFLLQPLVENAVRHGASLEYGDTEILISITDSDNRLRVVVENDVAAPPVDPARIGTGLGTTRDRLRLLYGATAALVTTREADRFRVTVDIPAHSLPPSPPAQEQVRDTEHARTHR
jgi:two-component system, LytTR family, sensor kinase